MVGVQGAKPLGSELVLVGKSADIAAGQDTVGIPGGGGAEEVDRDERGVAEAVASVFGGGDEEGDGEGLVDPVAAPVAEVIAVERVLVGPEGDVGDSFKQGGGVGDLWAECGKEEGAWGDLEEVEGPAVEAGVSAALFGIVEEWADVGLYGT